MKSIIVKSAFRLSLIILAFFTVTITSCRKDKTCYGTVKVIAPTGAPVSGAAVHLAAPSVGGQVTYDAVTDGNGEAQFEIKLPAIFDITATHPGYPGQGLGVLRCDEPGKKSGTTVTII